MNGTLSDLLLVSTSLAETHWDGDADRGISIETEHGFRLTILAKFERGGERRGEERRGEGEDENEPRDLG